VAIRAGELLSVACTVNELDPAAEGTPVICPVEVFKLRPAGNVPLAMEYLNGAFPPAAWQLEAYRAATLGWLKEQDRDSGPTAMVMLWFD
jgi:hypothetical protein